ncbi:preprotein translocase subunit SecG [Thermus thermamylovorans]|uniref:Protein-export membrane protein SecG n=1 Tax=Thermus thermamylovorans TaxID=2509362 RepID=A0A4Q9B4Q5_9DEIN|nr:preprotein translocase subunit SecG [Thermus thermamylovorans]TBH20791.1 preprotein translocase subunit SecG [Thermus thermamylovorans]
MDFLYTLVILLFLGVSGFLVYLVLIQEPKQASSADLMGGAADLFSARGFTGGLYRLTVLLGVVFAGLALLIGLWPR